MVDTDIEWTRGDDGSPGKVWNPVTGCDKVSAGCKNCYAEAVANRFWGDRDFTDVRFHPERLTQPIRWRKPRRVFVNSMSDLFHEYVSFEEIAAVFGVMAACARHTFQVLTKRPERMREWFEWVQREWDTERAAPSYCESSTQSDICLAAAIAHGAPVRMRMTTPPWPLPNVWLGVSVEDQRTADARIPVLLDTPAAVRWVSYEPALAAVDFGEDTPEGWWSWLDGYVHTGMGKIGPCDEEGVPLPHLRRKLDWIVVGGESGPGARPFDVAWARSTVDACKAARVPVFVKQLGSRPRVDGFDRGQGPARELVSIKSRKGGDMAEWPEDLRVREFPEARKRAEDAE